MHYLIFIPNETIQKREALADAGFEGLVLPGEPDPFWFQIEGSGGPDGQPGLLVLPHSSPDESRNPLPGYHPQTQTWQQLPGSDCWIGWQTDNPPTPLDLKHVMVPSADGWTTKDQTRWPDLYTLAAPVLEMIEANQRDDLEFNYSLAADLVCECLRLNYRLTPAIVGALGLLDQDLLPRLASLATDFDRILSLIGELAQKKQPAPNS